MLIYINEHNEIKDVHSTKQEGLIEIELNDETNPFNDWTPLKICCYKVTVENGEVTSMTPYIDTRLFSSIDFIGTKLNEQAASLDYLMIMSDVEAE